MKLTLTLSVLFILALGITACKLFSQAPGSPLPTTLEKTPVTRQNNLPGQAPSAEGSLTPEAGATRPSGAEPTRTPTLALSVTQGQTPKVEAKQTSTSQAPAPPTFGKKPPQSQAAGINPADQRQALTRLSQLIGFQVVDQDGVNVGKVTNFIVNTCETYIIYFVMKPAPDLNLAAGVQLVIPFEVITINSGVFDVPAKTIQLALSSPILAGAPAFPDSMQLLPNDWEAPVRAYWTQAAHLSHLSTGCNVAGGSVTTHKIAYATQLLGAELKDGNHNLLGVVQEAILEPESGKIGFFVVSLADKQGLVLVPLAKVNIPKEALQPEAQIELVLLTENKLLANAPRIKSVEEASNPAVQGAARQYWGR
jgi:sporulation protein YlmC with PRC-barrel domain